MTKSQDTARPNSDFTLYGIVPYDRSAKVRWLLEELGVGFNMVWLDREKKEFDQPDYLKLNPMGRVPLLRRGQETIFESAAICSYLADVFSERGLAPKVGTSDRGRYEQWMYFAANTLDTFQTRMMIIEDIPTGEVQTAKLKDLQVDFHDALSALNVVLSENSFLVANKFSVADICVSYHLYWCTLWPELTGALPSFQSVTSYMARMKAYPSAERAEVFSYPG